MVEKKCTGIVGIAVAVVLSSTLVFPIFLFLLVEKTVLGGSSSLCRGHWRNFVGVFNFSCLGNSFLTLSGKKFQTFEGVFNCSLSGLGGCTVAPAAEASALRRPRSLVSFLGSLGSYGRFRTVIFSVGGWVGVSFLLVSSIHYFVGVSPFGWFLYGRACR